MKKRSVRIAGHATSITLEDEFWDALKTVASGRNLPVNDLIAEIDATRGDSNLSSAIRVFILGIYKKSHPGSGTNPRD